MTPLFRVILMIAVAFAVIYIVRKLRKSQVQLLDALFWIAFSVLLVLFGVFPKTAFFMARLLGMHSPISFIFLCMVFISLFRCFILTIRVSKLETKLVALIQEIAIKENMRNKNED